MHVTTKTQQLALCCIKLVNVRASDTNADGCLTEPGFGILYEFGRIVS